MPNEGRERDSRREHTRQQRTRRNLGPKMPLGVLSHCLGAPGGESASRAGLAQAPPQGGALPSSDRNQNERRFECRSGASSSKTYSFLRQRAGPRGAEKSTYRIFADPRATFSDGRHRRKSAQRVHPLRRFPPMTTVRKRWGRAWADSAKIPQRLLGAAAKRPSNCSKGTLPGMLGTPSRRQTSREKSSKLWPKLDKSGVP